MIQSPQCNRPFLPGKIQSETCHASPGRAARASRRPLAIAAKLIVATALTMLMVNRLPAEPAVFDNPAEAEPGGELVVHLVSDSIEVVGGDYKTVEIVALDERIKGPAPTITLRREGRKYVAQITPPAEGLHYRALVPRQFSLDLRSVERTVSVTNIEGNVKVRTASGTINLARIKGDVEAQTASGPIALQGATGRVKLKTASGNCALGEVAGETEVETISGTIKLMIARGPAKLKSVSGAIKIVAAFGAVEAESSSGSVSVGFMGQPERDSRLRTANGSVAVQLAPSLAFNVRTEGPRDKMKTDLPIVWQDNNDANRREGKLNDGGRALELQTGRGDTWIDAATANVLPLVDKTFEFFKTPDPVPAGGIRPVTNVRDAFPDEPGVASLPAGVILPDGSSIAGTIVSVDDTQVLFQSPGAEQQSLLLTKVAVVLFHPLPESKRAALNRTSPGLLFRNGDFLEGESRKLEEGKIVMSSVLFGLRSVNVTNQAMALVLQAPKVPAPKP